MSYCEPLSENEPALMKRQIAQEGQIDARGAGEVVVDRVGVLIHLIGELQQGQRHIGGDRHVELGLAEGGHDERRGR